MIVLVGLAMASGVFGLGWERYMYLLRIDGMHLYQ
jgi:hypothetical protein